MQEALCSTSCDARSGALWELCHLLQSRLWEEVQGLGGLSSATLNWLQLNSHDVAQPCINRLGAKVIRAMTAFAPEYPHAYQGNEAARLCRKVLSRLGSLSTAERRQLICVGTTESGSFRRCRAGELLDSLTGICQRHVDMISSEHTSNAYSVFQSVSKQLLHTCQAFCDDTGCTTSPEDLCKAIYQAMPSALERKNTIRHEPGVQCDACGETGHLQKCQRCGHVWYCSRACQRKAWSERHKEECRPPGELKPGDSVALLAATGVERAMPKYKLLELDASHGPGYWRVRSKKTGEVVPMHTSEFRLHPFTFRDSTSRDHKGDVHSRAVHQVLLQHLDAGKRQQALDHMESHPNWPFE